MSLEQELIDIEQNYLHLPTFTDKNIINNTSNGNILAAHTPDTGMLLLKTVLE